MLQIFILFMNTLIFLIRGSSTGVLGQNRGKEAHTSGSVNVATIGFTPLVMLLSQ